MPENIENPDANQDDENGNGSVSEDIEALKQELETIKKHNEDLNQAVSKYRNELKDKSVKEKELEQKLSSLSEKKEPVAEDVPIDQEVEKTLNAWAKKQGFVSYQEIENLKKEQSQKEQQGLLQGAVNQFLSNHPEYTKDDTAWEKVNSTFWKLYKTQSSVAENLEVLEEIHERITGTSKDKIKSEILAQQKTNSRLSLGGSPQGTYQSKADKEIAELKEKYPTLSEEQIKTQIAEIEKSYKEQKERVARLKK